MKTEKAHQIANPEILEILEDLEEREADNWAIEYMHPFLKGILTAQEKELRFLEDEYRIEDSSNEMRDRIEALKISNEDLRRVLK